MDLLLTLPYFIGVSKQVLHAKADSADPHTLRADVAGAAGAARHGMALPLPRAPASDKDSPA
jgi:hypothetical protein